MRYSAIVHLFIIYLAIQSLYSGVNYIIGNFYSVVVLLLEDLTSFSLLAGAPLYLSSGLLSVLIGFIILIRSAAITRFVVERSKFADNVKVSVNAKQLLSVVIVFLALSSLLIAIPNFLTNLWSTFRENAGAFLSNEETISSEDWYLSIVKIFLPCLMIVFCKPLTVYFSKNIFFDEDIQLVETEIAEADDTAVEPATEADPADDNTASL
ncbi:hypothetical protein [Aridibaculum aurantiacum]|uniref:hypothetical protein n=1 Tax=Aridibaculum aurantiacum TaxID=2810307 RepID=UPI001A9669EF|nr:hypothetical protein [Aridibaculum aurantiacum]